MGIDFIASRVFQVANVDATVVAATVMTIDEPTLEPATSADDTSRFLPYMLLVELTTVVAVTVSPRIRVKFGGILEIIPPTTLGIPTNGNCQVIPATTTWTLVPTPSGGPNPPYLDVLTGATATTCTLSAWLLGRLVPNA